MHIIYNRDSNPIEDRLYTPGIEPDRKLVMHPESRTQARPEYIPAQSPDC